MKSRHVVLVGGGHAHALVLAQLQKSPIPGARFTVIDPGSHAPYTGMLPGYVAGHYTRDQLYIDIQSLCAGGEVTFIQDRVVSANSNESYLVLESGERIDYDYVSYDVGIHSNMSFITGFSQYAVPVKPLGGFAETWSVFLKKYREEKVPVHISMIGGGVAGVEMALAIEYALNGSQGGNSHVTIYDHGVLLSSVGSTTRHYLKTILNKRNISAVENTDITEIHADYITLNNQTKTMTDLVVGAAGARPHEWLENIGLDTHDGFIIVSDTLQSTSHANIFAVGDCAYFVSFPLQKAGVYAVRQAPILYNNISALIEERQLQSYVPQHDYIKLISLGEKKAVLDKWGLCFRGKLFWRLKNYIDKKFMMQFMDE